MFIAIGLCPDAFDIVTCEPASKEFFVLSYVNLFSEPRAVPPSLNCICVSAPCAPPAGSAQEGSNGSPATVSTWPDEPTVK